MISCKLSQPAVVLFRRYTPGRLFCRTWRSNQRFRPTFCRVLRTAIRQRGGIAGGKVQAVNPPARQRPRCQDHWQARGAHPHGFRRSGQSFHSTGWGKGRRGLGQKLGKCSMRSWPVKVTVSGAFSLAQVFQRAGTGHDQLRCVRPQQLPQVPFTGGAQPFNSSSPAKQFRLRCAQGSGGMVRRGHTVGLCSTAVPG